MLLNLGFGLTILAAILLLVLAWAVSWYGEHLATVGSVNGQGITRDQFRTQLEINTFRTDYQQRRISTLLTAGRIRTADAEARLAILDERTQRASAIALEQLIDGMIQAELAEAEGITVTDAEIDERLTAEATTPELRRAWMIAIEPQVPEGESAPDDPARAEARAKADKALADLRGGKDWETVARSVSSDPSREQAGDLGFIDEDAALDPAFVDALMAAEADTPTGVVEGADGVLRIGRVTQVVPAQVDPTLASQVETEGIALADFRAALRRDAVREKLDEKIVAGYLEPGPQRLVSEIYLEGGASEGAEGAVKARHILYSPNDDPQAAGDLPEGDPAWAAAEAEARATYEELKADISQFDAVARAESDEGSARTTGGKLPYFSPEDPIDPAFAEAVFAPGLEPGQLLEPVRSQFGWHVIQVMRHPTDIAWAGRLKEQLEAGTLTFAEAARDNSDRAEAAEGGSLGWVARGQLDEAREQAIFAAPIGKVSEPLSLPGQGVSLFLVEKEEVREPDAEQRAALERSAFSRWYAKRKAEYQVTRDASVSSAPTG